VEVHIETEGVKEAIAEKFDARTEMDCE